MSKLILNNPEGHPFELLEELMKQLKIGQKTDGKKGLTLVHLWALINGYNPFDFPPKAETEGFIKLTSNSVFFWVKEVIELFYLNDIKALRKGLTVDQVRYTVVHFVR